MQRTKAEQEIPDQYRAKYESFKHVKTLEAQQQEYTRVNEQLHEQNDQFREITQTQMQIVL